MMNHLLIFLFALVSLNCMLPKPSTNTLADPDTSVLLGEWQLDMTPENPDDNNFAKMVIREINNQSFKGIFYRDGVSIREGRLNTQRGIIYGALVSGDNSGEYNSTFYYEDGVLYGSTHAIGRDFLAVWTATRL